MAENLAELPGLKEGQEIIKPMSDPIKSSGHLQVHMLCLRLCRLVFLGLAVRRVLLP